MHGTITLPPIKAATKIEPGDSPESGHFVDIFFKDEVHEVTEAKAEFHRLMEEHHLHGTIDLLVSLEDERGGCGWRYRAIGPIDQDKAVRAFRNELM